jgi:integrase
VTPREAKRRTLLREGRHGRTVRCFIERGGDLVRVQWRVNGAVRTESRPNTPAGVAEMKAFAQTLARELSQGDAGQSRLTTRELWEKYAEAEFPSLRIRSRQLVAAHWKRWELLVTRDSVAEEIGPDKLAEFRTSLERVGVGVTSTGKAIAAVKRVYGWADEHELIRRDRLAKYRYKIAKDKRPEPVAEYRMEEFAALLAHLPLTGAKTWRAAGILTLCGYQGVRQWSAMHLQWEDIDREAGTITWRAEWDKQGREWTQPLRLPTAVALVLLHRWRKDGNPWVFWTGDSRNKSPVYTRGALWRALVEAEKRAGLAHKRNRGAHGLRRLLAGEVMAQTGNVKDAMDAIGDRDLRVMQRYLVKREDRVREVFGLLDTPKPQPETQPIGTPGNGDGQ